MTSSEMSVFQTHRIRIYDKLRSAYQYIIQDELSNHTLLEPKLKYVMDSQSFRADCFAA